MNSRACIGTIQLALSADVDTAQATLTAATHWLDAAPQLRWQRLPYRLTWLLLPEIPVTEAHLLGHRGSQGPVFHRVPKLNKTSYWPAGTVAVKANGHEVHVSVELRLDPRTARLTTATSIFFLVFGSLVGGFLGFVLQATSPLAWAGLGFGPLMWLIVRWQRDTWIRIEVEAFERTLREVFEGLLKPT